MRRFWKPSLGWDVGDRWQLAHRTDWGGGEVIVWGVLDQADPDAFSHVIATAVSELERTTGLSVVAFLVRCFQHDDR